MNAALERMTPFFIHTESGSAYAVFDATVDPLGILAGKLRQICRGDLRTYAVSLDDHAPRAFTLGVFTDNRFSGFTSEGAFITSRVTRVQFPRRGIHRVVAALALARRGVAA